MCLFVDYVCEYICLCVIFCVLFLCDYVSLFFVFFVGL